MTRSDPLQPAKPLLRVLCGETVTPPPLWLMRQAGRYLPEYREVRARAGDFLSLCYTPELAAEVTLQPVRRFDLDAAILFADILLVPDALGQDVTYRENSGPILTPIRAGADLAALDPSRLDERLAPVYETVREVAVRLEQESNGDVALIGFAGAPWTVAFYMVEGRGGADPVFTRQWAETDPEGFSTLIDILVDATARYLIAQVDAGADVLQIFDSWAGLLDDESFKRWSVAPIAEIVRRVRAVHAAIPIIGFARGVGAGLPAFVAATAVTGIGIDSAVLPAWAAGALQPHCTVQGNLDPELLRTGGEAMRAGAHAILDALGRGRFIFNLGHGILPDTPPEHVADLCRTVRAWHG